MKLLKKSQNRSSASGFTVVELIIVIVVIGIIATLSTIYYIGTRNRADAARASAAAETYSQVLGLILAKTNNYPSTNASPTGEFCLGKPTDFPAAAPFAAGVCLYNSSGYTVSASQTLNDTLDAQAPVSTGLLSTAKLGVETWRGIRYSYNPTSINGATGRPFPPRLEWVVNGSVSCGLGKGTPGYWWGSTWCTYDLPDA